jgi:hypothetical protein
VDETEPGHGSDQLSAVSDQLPPQLVLADR